MKLQLIRHLWGVDDPLSALPRFKSQGYQGIEAGVLIMPDTLRLVEEIHGHGFDFIPQIFTMGFDPATDVSRHVDSFAQQLQAVAGFDPVRVVCHGGRDAWDAETAVEFYEQVLKISREFPFPVAHETHRGRYLYNPWNCAAMLERFADLRLCCDFSHWVCVCERLIDDQLDIIRAAASRCIHLHARVGYENGPQVPDPAAPQYAPHLEAHERWWDIIWKTQRDRGDAVSTLTPEFGPPTYMHTRPQDNSPVADLEAVCNWMATRQSRRFADFLTNGSSG
jgi:hypothetical protein